MKIKEIKHKSDKSNTFVVTLIPNWFERRFGIKEREEEYKTTGRFYHFGGGDVYIGKDGESLGNGDYIGEAIDNWRRSW